MNKTVTLVDGTIKELQYGGDVVCGLCGEEYTFEVSYCDENIGCASDDGESLIVVG
jgi:transcription elongation factor Elf1